MAKKQAKKTQTSEVLKYMSAHKCIDDNVAHDKFGVNRLSSIIFNLRKKGFVIETVMCEGKNRYGGHVRYGKYYLRGGVN